MRFLFNPSSLGLLVLCFSLFACQQNDMKPIHKALEVANPSLPEVDTTLFETFKMTEGDTTYLMKKYYMVFLKQGPNRSQSKEETAVLQKAHLEHMNKLAEEKKIVAAGPFDDDSDIQGIVIYSVSNLEEAKQLTSGDPMVKAGRLAVEVHPWWAAVGTTLY